MKKYKHNIMVFVGSVLFAHASYAQIPVFDFTEIIPIGQDVADGIKTVFQLKEQLKNKNLTLNSIGKETNSFSSFSKGLKKTTKTGKKIANNLIDKTRSGEELIKLATIDISTIAGATISAQKGMVGDYVQIFNNKGKVNLSCKLLPQSLEEVTDIKNKEEKDQNIELNIAEEEIGILQNAVMQEQKQLAEEFNDVVESQLTALNKSAVESEKVLNDLSVILNEMKKVNGDDKLQIQEKITQISKKQRKTNDLAIKIVEEIKENYNKEYNRQVKDGINNYTKAVIAYTKGDATHESIVSLGERLNENMRSINVEPDVNALNELYKTMAAVRLEIENLVTEVNEILTNS